MKRKLLLLLLIALAGLCNTIAQVTTRGWETGEVVLSRFWHVNQDWEKVHAIWHSTDNGRHFSLQHASTTLPEQGTLFNIVSDAASGVLYGTNENKLYVSWDFGSSWEFVEETGQDGRYASGCIQGEVYKYNYVETPNLWRSSDYAGSFDFNNSDIYGYPEIGVDTGEVYFLAGVPSELLLILKSEDFGSNFDTIEVNPEISGNYIMGRYPKLSRGWVSGELYLVTWHLPANYHIYYSSNYGETFQLQYQSEECDLVSWGFSFSAGREPGSFYVVRGTGNDEDQPTHTHLYVDYSADYGQNFTTFFHNMDSTYLGNPSSVAHTVSLEANPAEGGIVEGEGSYQEGENITVNAIPDEEYSFISWTVNNEVVSEEPSYTFAVMDTQTLVANFQLINTISNPQSTIEISIYPNPATGQATLSIPNVSSFKNSTLYIINLYGQTVKVISIKEKHTRIDLTDLPAGSYLYRLTDDGIIIKTGKIIIN